MFYQPAFEPTHDFIDIRGRAMAIRTWGNGSQPQTLTVLLHGWMDMGASFQFLVDALKQSQLWESRTLVAVDWQGFGDTYLRHGPAAGGHYAYVDYLADLDALLKRLSPERPVNLVGHSMGGNIAMLYAGARPERVAKLVNLEGVGLPGGSAAQAPDKMTAWLDALEAPAVLSTYPSVEGVINRLQKNNPRLTPDRAAWLAHQWAYQTEGGRWAFKADAAHKRPGPHVYRVEEVLACWRRITAPLLVVEGADTRLFSMFAHTSLGAVPYDQNDFHERLKVVRDVRLEVLPDAGHMLQHDQPEALATCLNDFLK